MSKALRSDEYVVITSIGGRTRSRVWDARKPLAIGHPLRWVLEKTPEGGFCVRDICGSTGQVMNSTVRRFGPKELASRTAVPLPDGKGGAGATRATLKLEAVRPIAPPHHPMTLDAKALAAPLTFVFAGVRKMIISSASVQAGYAAYAGTRPAFTVSPATNGFKLKPLMDHLTLTSAKGNSIQLSKKEALNLAREELLTSTITHGQYWWKFGLVSTPAAIRASGGDLPFVTEDNARFRKAISLALSLYALFMLLMWLAPPSMKEDKPPEEIPIVKFDLPKRNSIAQVPQKRPEAQSLADAAPAAPAESQKAPEPEKAPPKAEEKKPAEPVKSAEKVPDQKPEPVKAEATRPVTPAAKTKPRIVVAAHKAAASVVNTAKKIVDSAAQVAAKARTKMLRDLLGGAMHGLSSDHKLEAMASKTTTQSAASALGNIGAADAAMASPTEVKPGLSGSAVKVSSLGGKDGGSKGSAVGYAVGEHAAIQGQGASFVAVSSNGASVDEGLTKEEVGALIHSHMGEIRYCHDAAMLSNPTIQGKLVLQWTIAANGAVESPTVQSSTLPDQKLSECVISKLQTWRFPHPKRGVKVSVAYPFLFKVLGRE